MKDYCKEIHFYKDLIGVSLDTYLDFIHTHNQTQQAIDNDVDIIYTTSLSSLCFSYLLSKGYTIVLHENGKSGIVHEGTTVLTDKELRKSHDISRIWIGGGFASYFYNRDKINDLKGYSNYE